MPYHLVRRGDKTCVVKGKTGENGPTVACHDSSAKAERHLRALYAAEKKSSSTDAELLAAASSSTTFAPIRLYFSEGEKTPDRRVIDPNAVNYDRPPPWPLRIQFAQPESGGHAGAIICGVLTHAIRDNLTHVIEGRIDLGSSAGREALRLIESGVMATWSPDLGDATVDIEVGVEDEDGNNPQEELAHFVKATFLGATLVAMPALASAVVELLNEDGSVLLPAPKRENLPREPEAPATLPTAYDADNPQRIVSRTDQPFSPIAACAGPSAPPSSFFTDPKLPELQRYITVTPEGRVFGHAAGHAECHIGFPHRCVTIAEIADCRGEGNFEYATPGFVITAEGDRIPVGPLIVTGGHAPKSLGWQQALGHYDNPADTVANVVHGMDEHGVWFSGAIAPLATEAQIRTLLAHGVSLDARDIDGKLRYLATCSVTQPGLPKVSVRLAASAEGEEPRILALIAAGGVPIGIDDTSDCGCDTDSNEEDDMELAERLTALEDAAFTTLDSRIGTPSPLTTPIFDADTLIAAITAAASTPDETIRRHLKSRARDLNRMDLIPASWCNDTDVDLALDALDARLS